VVDLAYDPQLMFSVMEKAYRTGLLDKGNAILGDALSEVIRRNGLNMEDLINRMDMAKEETVRKLDRALERSTPLLKLAGNEGMMRRISRLLDSAAVRRLAVKGMVLFLERTMAKADGTLPPVKEQLRSFALARRNRLMAAVGRAR
jgi:hypothetical protein